MEGIRRFTREEACEYLGCGKSRFYRLKKAGYLSQGIRVGKSKFWFEDQLNKTLQILKKESEKGMRKCK